MNLDELYKLRTDFVIIGLTGRLGSGCSTVADILTKNDFYDCQFPNPQVDRFQDNEERKYRIAYNYLQNNWEKFTLIRASDIIVFLLLKKGIEELDKYLSNAYKVKYKIQSASLIDEFANLKTQVDSIDNFEDEDKDKLYYDLFFTNDSLKKLSKQLKEEFKRITKTPDGSPFQRFGDNLRKTGDPFNDSDADFNSKNSYIIAEHIKKLIKVYRAKNDGKARIVIDSIRNSFEARYFRERYSAFYLFAVNTEDKYRETRLARDYSKGQIKSLDIEYVKNLSTKDTFYKQDIKSCIQMADIYLHNPTDSESCGDTFKKMKMSIVRYLALIFQPGIITPTSEERTMQIAYTAKYNSGCISRQVGAVVTDNSFSVKSIGWNNTPQGQTPCLLRNAEDLIKNTDNESFSTYEKSNEVKELVNEAIIKGKIDQYRGKNPCFCFKQVQNTIEAERNQVHTRSLHAEENAMLQISKYGGEGLTEGFLFTTASPCELCSKKAYQLGVQKIFYIDPYPGIATSQIIDSGTRKPKLVLFTGAVGKAYHAIFEPFMAYKDELEIQLDISFKEAKKTLDKPKPEDINKKIQELTQKKNKIEKEVEELKKVIGERGNQ